MARPHQKGQFVGETGRTAPGNATGWWLVVLLVLVVVVALWAVGAMGESELEVTDPVLDAGSSGASTSPSPSPSPSTSTSMATSTTAATAPDPVERLFAVETADGFTVDTALGAMRFVRQVIADEWAWEQYPPVVRTADGRFMVLTYDPSTGTPTLIGSVDAVTWTEVPLPVGMSALGTIKVAGDGVLVEGYGEEDGPLRRQALRLVGDEWKRIRFDPDPGESNYLVSAFPGVGGGLVLATLDYSGQLIPYELFGGACPAFQGTRFGELGEVVLIIDVCSDNVTVGELAAVEGPDGVTALVRDETGLVVWAGVTAPTWADEFKWLLEVMRSDTSSNPLGPWEVLSWVDLVLWRSDDGTVFEPVASSPPVATRFVTWADTPEFVMFKDKVYALVKETEPYIASSGGERSVGRRIRAARLYVSSDGVAWAEAGVAAVGDGVEWVDLLANDSTLAVRFGSLLYRSGDGVEWDVVETDSESADMQGFGLGWVRFMGGVSGPRVGFSADAVEWDYLTVSEQVVGTGCSWFRTIELIVGDELWIAAPGTEPGTRCLWRGTIEP